MATKNTTFKFNDVDLEILDELAADLQCSRTQAVRVAVTALRKTRGLHREALERLIAKLKAPYDEDAVMTIALDDQFDALATINGDRLDIYLPTHVSTWVDAAGRHEDYLMVYLGDPDSDARLAVAGLFPLQAGLSVSFALSDLSPDMRPRPVAWFVP
jgi:hypothetical protein